MWGGPSTQLSQPCLSSVEAAAPYLAQLQGLLGLSVNAGRGGRGPGAGPQQPLQGEGPVGRGPEGHRAPVRPRPFRPPSSCKPAPGLCGPEERPASPAWQAHVGAQGRKGAAPEGSKQRWLGPTAVGRGVWWRKSSQPGQSRRARQVWGVSRLGPDGGWAAREVGPAGPADTGTLSRHQEPRPRQWRLPPPCPVQGAGLEPQGPYRKDVAGTG